MRYPKDDNLILLSKMNALRIMKDEGVEKALYLYPELSDFIHYYAHMDFKVAKKQVFNAENLHPHEY